MPPSRRPRHAAWPNGWKTFTPKHGGWLNIGKIGLSAVAGRCLHRRIPDLASMRREVAARQQHRNHRAAPINWRFTAKDARIKLPRPYPKL